MRALVWTAPLQAELRTIDAPEPGAGELVLAVHAVGICGSDLHGYRGHSPLRVPPLVLGHELVGADPGGRLHVVNPLIGCDRCALCAVGKPNLCPDRELLGLNRPGAFAELVAIPERNLHPLPDGMDPVVGTLVEPLATSMNALRGLALDASSTAVVLGAGPIGLLAVYAARRLGAGTVICHDIDASRVATARALAHVADASPAAIAEHVRRSGDGLGAAVVVDAVGVEPTWTAAIELVRPGGTVLAVGLGQATGAMAVGDLVRRGITVRGVYAYDDEDFRAALDLLTDEPPPLDWLGTASLEDGPAVLAAAAAGEGPAKTVFLAA
jgi:threonine dehydrogenase-like Zn-dependent dehydrogenase